MKILAVDGDDDLLEIRILMLRAIGYSSVTTAASGSLAARAISATTEPFNCILLDLKMPGMDGIQLCHVIRESSGYRDTPVIMLTAVTDKVHIDQAFTAGATTYVMKPFDVLKLGARLKLVEKLIDADARFKVQEKSC